MPLASGFVFIPTIIGEKKAGKFCSFCPFFAVEGKIAPKILRSGLQDARQGDAFLWGLNF